MLIIGSMGAMSYLRPKNWFLRFWHRMTRIQKSDYVT